LEKIASEIWLGGIAGHPVALVAGFGILQMLMYIEKSLYKRSKSHYFKKSRRPVPSALTMYKG
jgi:hypothetical protein